MGTKKFPLDEIQLERLYWEEYKNTPDIAKEYGLSTTNVRRWLLKYGIPTRPSSGARHFRPSTGGGRYLSIKDNCWKSYYGKEPSREHIKIVEELLGRKLLENELVHHRDSNDLNNHPLNLEVSDISGHSMSHERGEYSKPSMFFNYMVFAYALSLRSSCKRLKVGSVITNFDLQEVYSIGYNGTASGLEDCCDSEEEGNCGCIHSEENALIKCSKRDPDKILFVTNGPCLKCAKLIINSGFSWVYYAEPYRITTPLSLLHYSGIKTCPYPIYISKGMETDGGGTFDWASPLTGERLCPCGCGKLIKNTLLRGMVNGK